MNQIQPKPLDPELIAMLKTSMEQEIRHTGKPLFYEIIIDGVKVIFRTNDLSKFLTYKKAMSKYSKLLEVRIFTSEKSRYCRVHQFVTGENQSKQTEAPQMPTPLNGLVTMDAVDEKIRMQKLQWDHEQLQKDFAKQAQELKESDDYNDIMNSKYKKLEDAFAELNKKSDTWNKILDFIKLNPQFLNQIPFIKELSGVQSNTQATPSEPAVVVSFKKKTAQENELSEQEKEIYDLLKYLSENLDEKELKDLVVVLESFCQDSSQISSVVELVNKPIKQ